MRVPEGIAWDVREQVFWKQATSNRTSVEFRAKWYGHRLLFPQVGRPVVRPEEPLVAQAGRPAEEPLVAQAGRPAEEPLAAQEEAMGDARMKSMVGEAVFAAAVQPDTPSPIRRLVDSYRDQNPEITQRWREPEPDAADDPVWLKGFTVQGMPLDRMEPRFHDFLRLFGEPGGVMMTEDKIEVWFLDGSPPLTLTVNRPFQHMRIT